MKELIKKYPKIFKDYEGNPYRVNWDCPEGWLWILDDLCGCIQDYIDHTRIFKSGEKEAKHPDQIECVQVKEKYGEMRFYASGYYEITEGMIKYAEYLSRGTCQSCGTRKNVGTTKGWIVRLCVDCKDKVNMEWELHE